MKLLLNFDEKKVTDKILTFLLKNDNQFMEIFPIKMRSCYVESEELNSLTKALNESAEKILSSYLPDKGSIKSGEFGEILSYYLLIDFLGMIEETCPKKWQWKEDKNKAPFHSDVILFSYHNEDIGNNHDFLIVAEIKANATKGCNYNAILKAVNGVEEDITSRLSKTLVWLKDKYTKLGDSSKLDLLKRFEEPISAPYQLYYNAVAVVDSNFLNSETNHAKVIKTKFDINLKIIALSDLKEKYEKLYEIIPKMPL